MKKILILIPILLLAATACQTDNNQKLRDLKTQRDDLNAQISQLEKELSTNGELQKHENKIYVTTKVVKPVTFKHYIEVQGTVESDNNVFVPAEMPGIITSVKVKEGNHVKKGQLMATIDDDLVVRQMEQVKTQLKLATTVYERQKRLWEKEIGSEIQFLQAKTNKEAAENQLKVLEKQLEMTKITANISGTIDQIMLKEGEMAAAGKSGIRVVGDGNLKIKANLSEAYFGEVLKGDTATVQIPANDQNFVKPIFAVARAIDPGSRTFGIDIRPPYKMSISPNMMAIVTVNDYTSKNTITVPQNLIQTDSQQKFLFIAKKKNGKSIAKRRIVKTGKNYNNKVEIISGLEAGDVIITAGYQDVSNGQEITIQ